MSREKLEMFEELARIFSEDNNAVAQRELLVKEGTAKFADTAGEKDHHLQKMLQKHKENSKAISFGTIPYLGTFLTDLTMIDTAIPDKLADGLINFDKRRKEFEVLAQIKLLQGAANAYTIERDPRFSKWFESVLIMDEREAHELSCQVEPASAASASKGERWDRHSPTFTPTIPHPSPVTLTLPRFRRRMTPVANHRKNDSIASTVSGSSSSSVALDRTDTDSVRDDETVSSNFTPNESVRSRVSK